MSSISLSTTSLLRYCAVAATTLALGACGTNDPTPIVPDNSAAAGSLSLAPGGKGANPADYRLGPNDRTRIIVFGQPNLTGEFQLDARVYGRAGQPCLRCRTPIRRIVQNARATFFCPTCQKR